MNLQEVLEMYDDLTSKLDACLTDELLDARRLAQALVDASEEDFLEHVKSVSERDEKERGFSSVQMNYRNYALCLRDVANSDVLRLMIKTRFVTLISEYASRVQTVMREFYDTYEQFK